jgi:signal transduction histidine kinase
MVLAGYRDHVSAESPAAPVTPREVPARPRQPSAAHGPPLTKRIRPGHWVALDYSLAVCCVIITFGLLDTGTGIYTFPFQGWHAKLWVPPVLAICLAIPVAIRRRNPVRALGLLLLACVVLLFAGGQLIRGAFVPLVAVLYLVAATYRRAAGIAALAAVLAVLAFQGLIWQRAGEGAGNLIVAGLVMIISWMVGYAVRQRRAYAAHLWDQAASTAVTEERLRIARELHDVVAHSMTVVAVQAGFGEYVFDSQPGEARAALGAIQTVSREALSDMQRLLGVLRQAAERGGDASDGGPAGRASRSGDDIGAAGGGTRRPDVKTAAGDGRSGTGAPLAPAPGLADLDRLVARTAGAGVEVAVERTGAVRDVPAGIDLSAYRIVQEALTNVVKHSGASTCHVVIGYGTDDLSVEITDPGPCARARAGASGRNGAPLIMSAGHGIVGMRERVSLCGGEFSAAPLPDEGFRVTARLPLARGAP